MAVHRFCLISQCFSYFLPPGAPASTLRSLRVCAPRNISSHSLIVLKVGFLSTPQTTQLRGSLAVRGLGDALGGEKRGNIYYVEKVVNYKAFLIIYS